jgi:hypothetical protein
MGLVRPSAPERPPAMAGVRDAASLQGVEAHCAAGQYLMLRSGG